jgi:hypothetical protein
VHFFPCGVCQVAEKRCPGRVGPVAFDQAAHAFHEGGKVLVAGLVVCVRIPVILNGQTV